MVLIAVFLMFTGVASYATVTAHETDVKSCCDNCHKKDESSKPVPCSTPDCPAFLCLTMDIVAPFTPSLQVESVFIVQPIMEFPLSISTKPIFHPPVAS